MGQISRTLYIHVAKDSRILLSIRTLNEGILLSFEFTQQNLQGQEPKKSLNNENSRQAHGGAEDRERVVAGNSQEVRERKGPFLIFAAILKLLAMIKSVLFSAAGLGRRRRFRVWLLGLCYSHSGFNFSSSSSCLVCLCLSLALDAFFIHGDLVDGNIKFASY